jgi:CBS domain-containing protein
MTIEQEAWNNSPEVAKPPELRHLCGLDCPVTHLMARPPVFGDPEFTLRTVAEIMTRKGVGSLVLLGSDGPSALLTEHDLLFALASGTNLDALWATDVSSLGLLFLDVSDTIADAIKIMAREGVRHLPVRQSGEVVGMVSARDVIALVASLVPDRPE